MKTLLAVAAIALSFAAGTARADTIPISDDGALPWVSGPAANSPLEALLGTVSTTIAGRPAAVRCEGATDWSTLLTQVRAPASTLGYVRFDGAVPSQFTEVSPTVCEPLQRFALAASKPTKCPTTASEAAYVTTTARKQVKTRVRLRGVWRTKTVWRTETTKTLTWVTQPGPPVPCYTSPSTYVAMPESFWSTYSAYAVALQVIAHEAQHLGGNRSEAEAECYGMQQLAAVALQLGDTPDDARGIASYYANVYYPRRAGTSYGSSDCRADGPMDRTPGDGAWP